MAAYLTISQRQAAQAIPAATDFRLLVNEAVTALEAASMAAEMLSAHKIVESLNHQRLLDLLSEALLATSALQDAMDAPAKTVWPTLGAAQRFCSLHPLDDGRCYQLHPDGAGRCTISVLMPVERL